MSKGIKIFLTIVLSVIAISLVIGCKYIKFANLKKSTPQKETVYFNKGVYRTDSPDKNNSNKNYFYIFYDKSSGYTEDDKMGIGLPFSCVQKEGCVKFRFGGATEPEETFKIKSVENNVITGSFEDGSLLIFTHVLDANPDNFDAVEYVKKVK